MSSFTCDKCGAICKDSERGFVSGCEHFPPDIKPLRGFGFSLDIKTGNSRRWFVDQYGQKRWLGSEELVEE